MASTKKAAASSKKATATKKQPNILVIWGDDIGIPIIQKANSFTIDDAVSKMKEAVAGS
jgi:hypothetical protein